MKKSIASLLLLLLSAPSFAMSLTCVTSIPSTSVTAEVEGEDLVVHVIHHWGMKYMPITTGPISPDDIAGVIQKAELFKKLGDHYVFRWPVKNCTRTDADLFSCSNGQEVEIGGVKVKPWGVYTKRVHTEIDIAELNELEVNFNMNVEDKHQHISMIYMRNECQQTEKNKEVISKFLSSKN